MADKGFTGTQKQYLEGLASGLRLARRGHRTTPGGPDAPLPGTAPDTPDRDQRAAQDRVLAAGRRLALEERAKRRSPPEDFWPRLRELASSGCFPKGDEVFLCKFQGLFYVSPAEEAYMCRLRLPAGVLQAHQLRGLVRLTEQHAHPSLQLTSRSTLQLRGIAAGAAPALLEGLLDLGIVTRGAGADGVRNVCASPSAGFDRRELIDTAPLARQAHHRVISDRSLQALPRKLTVAIDGGGAIGTSVDTCDVGFRAVAVAGASLPTGVAEGVGFRLLLGGATSHSRYARDAGVLVAPERVVDVLDAVLRLYVRHGDRTNRRRARLAYLIESEGLETFVSQIRQELSSRGFVCALPDLSLDACRAPEPPDPMAHVGFHNQKPRGQSYVGVVVPSGRLSLQQASGLASIAERHGSGELRLTPRQNLLLPGLRDTLLHVVKRELEELGLGWKASVFRAGLVACTGSEGCQFASANTKRRGDLLVQHLESRVQNAPPLNIRISGCHHGCAQHTTADVGLLAVRRHEPGAEPESFQLWVGGRSLGQRGFGRDLAGSLPASEVARAVEGVVTTYLERREPEESFQAFVRRLPAADLDTAFARAARQKANDG